MGTRRNNDNRAAMANKRNVVKEMRYMRMSLEEQAEHLSKKYDIERSRVYDTILYIRGREVLKNPLLKIWHKGEVEEDAYEIANRYFRMENYKAMKNGQSIQSGR